MKRRSFIAGAVASATAIALSPARPQAGTGTVHEVTIRKFKFAPEVLEVQVGDTIRWTNKDLAPHTATANGKGWDTGRLGKNDSAELVASEGMEAEYFCIFHPHMKGTLKISGAA